MTFIHQLNQAGTVDVRIYLCRADVAMPEQRLQSPQVRTTLQQMGSKGMSQNMRTDFCWVYSCLDGMFPDDLEQSYPADMACS